MDQEAKFLTPLEATPLPDGKNWRVRSDLRFQDANGFIHVVHAGFVTDFASIPSLARIGASLMLLGGAWFPLFAFRFLLLGLVLAGIGFVICWVADSLNCDPLLGAPATLHDDGYRRQRLGQTSWTLKFYWDWILFSAMRANGEPLWKCWLIYLNVAVFGWLAWWQDGKAAAHTENTEDTEND
jgi:hypothetical protein